MIAALLAAALCAAGASPAPFESLEAGRFDIHFTASSADAAGMLGKVIEPERQELARRMGRDYEGPTRVFVVSGPEELSQLGPESMRPPVWASGAALPQANVLFFDARALRGDHGRELLRHELAHLALGRMGGHWPRWFSEGFAMLVAGEWSLARYSAMYRAMFKDAAIPFAQLDDRWPDRLDDIEVAYAQSFSFVSWLYERGGEEKLRELILQVAGGEEFAKAFGAVYGLDLSAAEREWRSSLKSRYSFLPLLTSNWAIWTLVTLIFVLAYLRVRHRRRLRLAQMELEEQAREAALRIAAAEQQQQPAAPEEPGPDKPDLLN